MPALVHVSFGINVWNSQMTVAMFNKPGIKALFAQSIKNAAPGGRAGLGEGRQLAHGQLRLVAHQHLLRRIFPITCCHAFSTACPPHAHCTADATVVSEALPASHGILVRSTIQFPLQAASANAQADTVVKYLTDAALLTGFRAVADAATDVVGQAQAFATKVGL